MIKDLLDAKIASDKPADSASSVVKEAFARELADLKATEIVKITGTVDTHIVGAHTIEIQSIEKIDGGIELFVRAWKNGVQLGFGNDGSIDIERFRVFNPPILVPDGTTRIETKRDGETVVRDNMKEDPLEAIKQDLVHTISLVGKEGTTIIPGKRGNTVDTFYPSSTTADNTIGTTENPWATVHDAATGDFIDDADLTARGYQNATNYSIERGYTGFDTAAIPDTNTIDSATVSLYIVTKYSADNDGDDWINVVQATPASAADTVVGDYDQLGAVTNPTEGSTRIDTNSLTTSAYNDWALNGTGLTWVSKTGYTALGWREGHDAINSPYVSAAAYTGMRASGSETAGTTQDPKLVVTHSAAGSAVTHKLLTLGVG